MPGRAQPLGRGTGHPLCRDPSRCTGMGPCVPPRQLQAEFRWSVPQSSSPHPWGEPAASCQVPSQSHAVEKPLSPQDWQGLAGHWSPQGGLPTPARPQLLVRRGDSGLHPQGLAGGGQEAMGGLLQGLPRLGTPGSPWEGPEMVFNMQRGRAGPQSTASIQQRQEPVGSRRPLQPRGTGKTLHEPRVTGEQGTRQVQAPHCPRRTRSSRGSETTHSESQM